MAEKAESASGWLFPVGDEVNSLGYTHMFTDMFDSLDNGGAPMESFYDGYIVNSVIDACYKSAKTKKWEPVEIEDWRGRTDVTEPSPFVDFDADHWHIKDEFLPDGRKNHTPIFVFSPRQTNLWMSPIDSQWHQVVY